MKWLIGTAPPNSRKGDPVLSTESEGASKSRNGSPCLGMASGQGSNTKEYPKTFIFFRTCKHGSDGVKCLVSHLGMQKELLPREKASKT